MQSHRLLSLASASVTIISLALLTACGSSSHSTQTQPSAPVFTSAPVMAATQDLAYDYQLAAVDPAGGSITFSLTTSPTGAMLSGSTVTWTPTAAESRVSNNFVVTATTASGVNCDAIVDGHSRRDDYSELGQYLLDSKRCDAGSSANVVGNKPFRHVDEFGWLNHCAKRFGNFSRGLQHSQCSRRPLLA